MYSILGGGGILSSGYDLSQLVTKDVLRNIFVCKRVSGTNRLLYYIHDNDAKMPLKQY